MEPKLVKHFHLKCLWKLQEAFKSLKLVRSIVYYNHFEAKWGLQGPSNSQTNDYMFESFRIFTSLAINFYLKKIDAKL